MAFESERYLTEAFQGETLGEAFFALLAEREADDAACARWRVLERLERHVKIRLGKELAQRGLPHAEDPARVAAAREHAAAFAAADSDPAGFRDSLQGFVDGFRESRDAAPEDLREIAEFVLGHEQALLAYAERVVAGEHEKSVEPVENFLRDTGAPEEDPLPEGLKLMALDDAFREDPYPILKRLRERAPVHRDRTFGRFVLTRHDDVMRVLRDLDFFCFIYHLNSPLVHINYFCCRRYIFCKFDQITERHDVIN